jgi:hypothetical protein
MIPMVLGELYLSLYLRRDEKNIGGYRKKRAIWKLLEQEKNIVIPNMTVLWG